jgi:hypothetical protein
MMHASRCTKQRKHPKPVCVCRISLFKTAVLNSLSSVEGQRGYSHAIDEFVDWYCSESRLALNRTVVLRYRSYLEARLLAPGTINLRLGAVRRLACEAADSGLLGSIADMPSNAAQYPGHYRQPYTGESQREDRGALRRSGEWRKASSFPSSASWNCRMHRRRTLEACAQSCGFSYQLRFDDL